MKGPLCASFCLDGSWKLGGGFSASPISSVSVAFDTANRAIPRVWAAREDHNIYYRVGTSGTWTRVDGQKIYQVSASSTRNRVLGVNQEGAPVLYSPMYNTFATFSVNPSHPLNQISVACQPGGGCEDWAVTTDSTNNIVARNTLEGGWVNIPGTLVHLSVAYGKGRSLIVGVNSSGKAYYRNGMDGNWNEFSSSPQLTQVSVAFDMGGLNFLIYGVTSGGDVYYRRSFWGDWTKVEGITLSYVSVAFDIYSRPMVWGVKNEGERGGTMYRWHVDDNDTFAVQRGETEINQHLISNVSLLCGICAYSDVLQLIMTRLPCT